MRWAVVADIIENNQSRREEITASSRYIRINIQRQVASGEGAGARAAKISVVDVDFRVRSHVAVSHCTINHSQSDSRA